MKRKIFLISEIFIYLIFVFLDLVNINSTYLKYFGVLLCLLYCFISKQKSKTLSLFFTCVADYYLLVKLDNYEFGIFVFILAQLNYLLMLNNIKQNKTLNYLRAFMIVFGLIVLYLLKMFYLLNILVVVYFTNLLVNTIHSYTINKILFVGFVLFVCCDVCVGLFNLNVLYKYTSMLMWVFYLPSQVLISLSDF